MAKTKTTQQHIFDATKYAAPSASVGSMLAIVLSYFFNLPAEVAAALAGLITVGVNLILVYFVQHERK